VTEKAKPVLKSQAEIQRAHDILHFLGLPQAPAIFKREGAAVCNGVHDALAWVLGFPCGKSFAANLEAAMEELRRHGYQEVDGGEPISAAEARNRGLL